MSTIFDVARWFLSKESMSHKKLQKLCYYAQAWSYALNCRPIAEATFQAWIHGPVCPELYQEYRRYGFDAIPKASVPAFSQEDQELLEDVWETYGDQTANALEALTHTELPWQKARVGYASNEKCEIEIDPHDMMEYYRSIYSGGDA